MSAQTYPNDPVAQQRMSVGCCPECGEPSDRHSNDPRFWVPRRCDLLARGVDERIAQYRADA